MSGFTLLEMAVAIALFMIITLSAGSLMVYSGNAGRKVFNEQEIMENGRISMDFIITQARSARGMTLSADSENSLERLEIDGFLPDGETPHTYLFRYVKSLQRLEFGGINDDFGTEGANTLAVGVERAEITVDRKKQIMTVTLIIGKGELLLRGETSIKYKKVVVI